MQKIRKIIFNILPVVLMVVLIPYVSSDQLLALIYILIIGAALGARREKHDVLALALGIVGMTISEYFFISTGVETFNRASLFGLMPLWLPLLWGYGFVAIKRVVTVLD